MILEKGDIIVGPRWPEPVKINSIDYNDNQIYLTGSTLRSFSSIEVVLFPSDLEGIEILGKEFTFSAESWKVFFSLEVLRYRYASLYDPLLAMNISKVNPLPHQIEAVYGVILKLPRIRFLIADDPGAGKTIMAGLIIKELKLRNLIKSVLIVAPSYLKEQWRIELRDKFEENFTIVDRNTTKNNIGGNVWSLSNQIITSIDFAKQQDILPSLESSSFDLIIVDEAHKMSATKYKDLKRTQRYRLGETLSKISDHLLFLTATPHKGDDENFRLFLNLLIPNFFENISIMREAVKNNENLLFIRRMKEDMRDFDKTPLFLPRHVNTIALEHSTRSPDEIFLYNELSCYIQDQYQRSLETNQKRNVSFALVIFQRRLASSVFALLKSLERRQTRLINEMNGKNVPNINKNCYSIDVEDYEDLDDLSEEDRWNIENSEEITIISRNKNEILGELKKVEELLSSCNDILKNEKELKIIQLRETLLKLNEDHPNEKILIFTEFKDTLLYLKNKIEKWGYSVTTIYGGMDLEERRNHQTEFEKDTQILVATEAAGEGINLQFCNLMINYDIPWNPNRLEQRMGRIHRYGQKKEVFVFNLVARDTQEGRVLLTLFKKLDIIKDKLGDKVFDSIGTIINDLDLSQLLTEAAAGARGIDEILEMLEMPDNDEQYLAKIRENLGESLATRFIDYTSLKDMRDKAKEQRLIPEYTEKFFIRAFEKAGGKIKRKENGIISIESIPFDIRKIADEDIIKSRYGSVNSKYSKLTFDKEISNKKINVEFISFGHPLFESVLRWIELNFTDEALEGAVFSDPDGLLNGYLFFYEGIITDGKGDVAGKRLFAMYSDGKITKSISPSILWDLSESAKSSELPFSIEETKKIVDKKVIDLLEDYRKDIQKERKRQCDIKRKYAIKSCEERISQLDYEIIQYLTRKENGENVDLPLRNSTRWKDNHIASLNKIKREIIQEETLTISIPRFVGIIRVVPSENKQMYRDEEIEKIGMAIAIEHEKKSGRNPKDVSSENLGFDIKSEDQNGDIRYIEVKARAKIGPVILTQNEWIKAERFKNEYYLYIVMNASSGPELTIIKNPTENINVQAQVVRYIIPYFEIVNKGEKGG